MIKKAVYRSLERRVRGEDDKIPPIKTVASDLPLNVLRSMDIRVDPCSAPTCAPPNALRIRPANARTSGAHVIRSDVRSYERLGPCARHRMATRARICSADFYTYTRGGLEDSAKIAKYSDEWCLSPPHRVTKLVRKAGAHRYLSFDPRDRAHREGDVPHRPQRQRARPACSTERASTYRPLPAPRPLARPLPNGVAWPVHLQKHRSRSGSPTRPCLRCSRLVHHTVYPSDVGGAEQRGRQSPHTAVFAGGAISAATAERQCLWWGRGLCPTTGQRGFGSVRAGPWGGCGPTEARTTG